VRWSDLLDSIVSRSATPPPVVTALRMPPIDGWERGRVWGEWKVDPDMLNAAGTVFGGYFSVLADGFLGLAMMSTLADEEWFTTSDLRVSFFRPVTKGTLQMAAEVLNRGRRMAHCECIFVNDDDKVVAKATATQVITPIGEGA
jgi:uncharacterized protein (TIGR00369 family)